MHLGLDLLRLNALRQREEALELGQALVAALHACGGQKGAFRCVRAL